jgi:lipopolysaccharide exporter
MRLGDHIGKGLWALAEKALVPAYGVGLVVLAFGVLPKEEIAVYSYLQSLFLLLHMATMTLVFRPMVKYVAERRGEADVTTTATVLGLVVMVLPAAMLYASAPIWGKLFHSESLAASMWVLVPLALVTVPRTATVELLKAQYRTRGMFSLSAIYWLGSLAGLGGLAFAGRLSHAIDILLVNCAAGVASTVLAGPRLVPLLRKGSFARHDVTRLLQFGRFSFGTGIGNYLLSEADLWVAGWMLTPELVGLYGAVRVFRRAYAVGAQFLETVVFPKASHLSSAGRLHETAALYEKVVCFFAMLLVPASVLLFVFARQFLNLVYGGRHLEATLPLQVLIVGGLTWPLRAVGGSLLHGMGRPRDVLSCMMIVLPVHWAVTVAGVHWLGVVGAPLAFGVSMALLAWLLTRRVAALIETSPAGVVSRTRDAWRFLINRLDRRHSPRS